MTAGNGRADRKPQASCAAPAAICKCTAFIRLVATSGVCVSGSARRSNAGSRAHLAFVPADLQSPIQIAHCSNGERWCIQQRAHPGTAVPRCCPAWLPRGGCSTRSTCMHCPPGGRQKPAAGPHPSAMRCMWPPTPHCTKCAGLRRRACTQVFASYLQVRARNPGEARPLQRGTLARRTAQGTSLPWQRCPGNPEAGPALGRASHCPFTLPHLPLRHVMIQQCCSACPPTTCTCWLSPGSRCHCSSKPGSWSWQGQRATPSTVQVCSSGGVLPSRCARRAGAAHGGAITCSAVHAPASRDGHRT